MWVLATQRRARWPLTALLCGAAMGGRVKLGMLETSNREEPPQYVPIWNGPGNANESNFCCAGESARLHI